LDEKPGTRLDNLARSNETYRGDSACKVGNVDEKKMCNQKSIGAGRREYEFRLQNTVIHENTGAKRCDKRLFKHGGEGKKEKRREGKAPRTRMTEPRCRKEKKERKQLAVVCGGWVFHRGEREKQKKSAGHLIQGKTGEKAAMPPRRNLPKSNKTGGGTITGKRQRQKGKKIP